MILLEGSAGLYRKINRVGNNYRTIHNQIYHNNFIENGQQAIDNGDNNYWNATYDYDGERATSGGNYWSDYSGTDDYHGKYQTIDGSDGIVDQRPGRLIEFTDILATQGIDHYPWTAPSEWEQ